MNKQKKKQKVNPSSFIDESINRQIKGLEESTKLGTPGGDAADQFEKEVFSSYTTNEIYMLTEDPAHKNDDINTILSLAKYNAARAIQRDFTRVRKIKPTEL